MLVKKYYKDGKEEVEIVRGYLSAGSYFRLSVVLSISFSLLYLMVSIIGYGYEKWFGGAVSLIGFGNYGWLLILQFFGILLGLFFSYPFYRLIVSRFFPHIFKFSGEQESDL